ncbi:hypothetical protein LCGC14_1999980 [marine sediment metagenome]|uniref:Uncharacterized protein n=1 Tax=marine sediment metagenome TaxID=412755 RepID=A0A0F9F3D1_9ZZZZ
MTEANQLKLYKHFLSLVDNPRVGLSGQENRVIIDKTFIVKQAKEQVAAILKVYPQFAEPEKQTKQSKGKN